MNGKKASFVVFSEFLGFPSETQKKCSSFNPFNSNMDPVADSDVPVMLERWIVH